MQWHQLLHALAALTSTAFTPTSASVIARQDADSISIISLGFFIMSHAGKNDTDEDGLGPYPPWTTYSTTVQLDNKWGECYSEVDYAQGEPGGSDCAGGIVDPRSLPSEGCSPPNGDTEHGLNGVSWNITRYGDTYVQQINVPDQNEMSRVYVACYTFYKSNFTCNEGYDEQFASAPDGSSEQYLTATVGQVCPTF